MSTNNKVFQVLVAPAIIATLAAKDSTLDALQVGQLGVFDSGTNLAIDETSVIPKGIYLAVKNSADQIDFSAGQEIQVSQIRSMTYKAYQAYVPFKAEIAGNFAKNLKVNTDYVLRLEVKSTEILQRQGTVQFTIPFVVSVGAVVDVSKFLKDFKTQISASNSDLFSIKIVDASNAELDLSSYSGDGTGVKFAITGSRPLTASINDINTRFQNIRQATVGAAFTEGYLESGATFTVTQAGSPEEGSGYNVKQREYQAGGWNGRPGIYRQGIVTGLALPGFEYRAKENGKYNSLQLHYANHSNAGWGDYWNDIQTFVEIDSEGTNAAATVTALTKVLNRIADRSSNYLLDIDGVTGIDTLESGDVGEITQDDLDLKVDV